MWFQDTSDLKNPTSGLTLISDCHQVLLGIAATRELPRTTNIKVVTEGLWCCIVKDVDFLCLQNSE